MAFTPASSASLAAFVALCAAIVALFVGAVARSERLEGIGAGLRWQPTLICLTAWLGLVALLVQTGVVAEQPMPRLPLFFAAANVVSLAAALAAPGRWLAATLPIGALVAFQGFRLPLELILHRWAANGTIPGTMTWTGQNWDVFSGLVALAAAPWAGRHRAVAWVANGLGLALLLNVGRVALLSSPLPFGWGVEPPLQLAFRLPYALIAPVCVGGALFGHVVLTRALLRPRRA